MKEIGHDLLHKAACGHLVQGLVHNMSGPLQIISMQIELMRTTLPLAPIVPEEKERFIAQQEARFAQLEEQLARLRRLLNAITGLVDQEPAPLDLNQVVEQLLLFWEGDLRFKHEVSKETRLSAEPVKVHLPPARLYNGLTVLFWWLVPHAVEKGATFWLETSAEGGPRLALGTDQGLPERDHFLDLAFEILSPLAEVSLEGGRVELRFREETPR